MAKHDGLTPAQKDLYDALKGNNSAYIDLIEKATKEDIKAILDCKFNNDLPLLAFIVNIRNTSLFQHVLKKLQKIYTEHPYDNEAREMSRKFFTSLLEVEVNQEKKQVRPLDYIIINDYALADLFVTYATERKIDLEDLTIQNVEEVAENIDVKKFIELVEKKMKEAGLPIDQHTSHPTQNEQQPLQSNLQGTDPSASVPAEPVPAQVAEENAHQQASGSEQPSAFGEELPTTTSQDQQDNDNLTEDQQQELYGNLKTAIKGGDIVKLSSLLQSLSKEDLRRVLTKQKVASEGGITGTLTLLCYALIFKGSGKEIEAILQNTFITDNKDILKEILTAKQKVEFLDGSKHTLTPLAYALTFSDGNKKFEAILQNIKDTTLLREVLTAQQEVEFSDGSKHTLTLLGYAMLFNDSSKKIEAILQNIKDTTLLKEILTAKQIVNGKECTLLQYADHYAPECVTIIEEKMKEAGLLDQHTSHPTQNEQQPLQSNLQGTDSPASVSAGTGPEDNDNLTENQQKLYDNLKSAIGGNCDIANLLKDRSEEDLRRVLTEQEVIFVHDIQETLTLLGYAMNCYDSDKKIKVILKHFSQYPILLKEILTATQKVTFSNGIERTFTLLNYAFTFNDNGSGKRIEVILQNIKYTTLLKEVLTATQKVRLSDGNIGTLTPLGHAMLCNGGQKKIKVILNNIHDQDLLEEILTAKQIVDGIECTLLQCADRYAPECVTIIIKKMKEVGLPIDQHTSQLPFFDQHKGKVALVASIVFIATATAAALITPWLTIVSIIAASIAIGVLGTAIYSEYKSQEAPDKSVSEAVRSTFKEMAAEFIATKKQGVFVG